MFVQRDPTPALRPFVATLWAQRSLDRAGSELSLEALRAAGGLEHVLPTGALHLVFRLGSSSLRVFDPSGEARDFAGAVIGGARAKAYRRDVTSSGDVVGVQLRLGAASLLFGGSATELSEAHTSLEAVWGREAERVRERLAEAPSLEARLDRVETALLARVASATLPRPEVAIALRQLQAGCSWADVVARSELSERRLRSVFADTVGLAPKAFARVVRFEAALRRLGGTSSAAQIALDSGFSDQAHFQREFKEIAGMSPGTYRRRAPANRHHVRG
ncbi:MAG: helix-turn-helix domain-containing protein [Polyangiales bacterium]